MSICKRLQWTLGQWGLESAAKRADDGAMGATTESRRDTR